MFPTDILVLLEHINRDFARAVTLLTQIGHTVASTSGNTNAIREDDARIEHIVEDACGEDSAHATAF